MSISRIIDFLCLNWAEICVSKCDYLVEGSLWLTACKTFNLIRIHTLHLYLHQHHPATKLAQDYIKSFEQDQMHGFLSNIMHGNWDDVLYVDVKQMLKLSQL